MDRTEKSIQYATEMAKGNFDSVYSGFDGTMKSLLTQKQLAEGWQNAVSIIGDYVGVYSSESNGDQIFVILEYAFSGLKVTFHYDASENISGLLLTTAYIPKGQDHEDDADEAAEAAVPQSWELREFEIGAVETAAALEAFATGFGAGDPIRLYLKEILAIRPMEEGEAAELTKKICDGDPAAKKRMAEANLRLAVSIARRYDGSGMPLLDLIQEGNLGLVKAIEKFDTSMGINFTAYAAWQIHRAIRRVLDSRIRTIPIKIGTEPYQLDGILRLPTEAVNPPVIILIQGSGQHDFDESIGPNRPFKDIADGLARRGIATVRYNKRYFQYPETAPENLTIEDEVTNDVGFAIDLIKKQKTLKDSKVFVLGHSLGGMLAPYIAALYKDISGIICMAGSPRYLEDIMLDQQKAAIDSMKDKTEEEKAQITSAVESQIGLVKALREDTPLTAVLGAPSSYWISLNRINTAEIVKDLDRPILIQQGTAAFQVYADVDYRLWQEILQGKTNAAFKLYDRLNHLFMPTNGKADISEYSIKSSVDDRVITDIARWIKT